MATQPQDIGEVLAANLARSRAGLTAELQERVALLTPEQMTVALNYLTLEGPAVRASLTRALRIAADRRPR